MSPTSRRRRPPPIRPLTATTTRSNPDPPPVASVEGDIVVWSYEAMAVVLEAMGADIEAMPNGMWRLNLDGSNENQPVDILLSGVHLAPIQAEADLLKGWKGRFAVLGVTALHIGPAAEPETTT